jgi:two-component system chemotaxis response regulator CheY
MIVDDMPAMRSILQDMLQTYLPASAFEFEDADSAWESLIEGRIEPVHLILLDVVLPGMSGLDLVRAIRSHPDFQGIRILMITSEGRLDHVDEALRSGADGYLVKPFQQERLHEWLQSFFPALDSV